MSEVFKDSLVKENIKREKVSEIRLANAIQNSPLPLVFKANPFNKDNHQFVSGKILGRESPSGDKDPETNYVEVVERVEEKPVDKFDFPQTSNQEFGWFLKYHTPTAKTPSQHRPIRHSELSQYMSSFWRYYPNHFRTLRGSHNPKPPPGGL